MYCTSIRFFVQYKFWTLTLYQIRVRMMHETLEPSQISTSIKDSKMSRLCGSYWEKFEKFREVARKVDLCYACINVSVTRLICMNGYEVNSLETPLWSESTLVRLVNQLRSQHFHLVTYLCDLFVLLLSCRNHTASSKKQTYQERWENRLIFLLMFIGLWHNQRYSLILWNIFFFGGFMLKIYIKKIVNMLIKGLFRATTDVFVTLW